MNRSKKSAKRQTTAPLRRLRVEELESRRVLTTPFGALPDDNGEFLLGKVAITPVFFESDGSLVAESQDWTANQIAETKTKLENAANWWVDTLANYTSVHSLEFVFDFTYADNPVATGYEPIDGSSDAYTNWVNDFLDEAGFNSAAGSHDDIKEFNNAQREAMDADWAFTIFIADADEDADGRFASGTFTLAFAFSTSKFIIAPSTRPTSTFTHEMAHMFWARDEYAGGGSYTDRRGYYNAQNLNAYNNPSGVQEASIMDDGTLFNTAYANNITSQSSREMLGWRDTDGDGVFDVLDVPHTLEATGAYNPNDDTFRLTGSAQVGTLPNLNSSGNQSDITINLIDVLEYRIDGGGWQEAAAFTNSYGVQFDTTVSMAGGDSIDFRTATYDPITGMLVTTSNVFMGGPSSANTTALPGISGVVYQDNGNAQYDDGEAGVPDAIVRLTDASGVPLVQQGVEPDDFDNGEDISTATPGVTLTAEGWSVVGSTVLARDREGASTGDRMFAFFFGPSIVASEWIEGSRELVMTFDQPTTRVAIDAVANSDGDIGRLEIYDSSNNLLGRYTTSEMANGDFETMELLSDSANIAYAVATGFAGNAIRLDNFEFGVEVETTTDIAGGYLLSGTPDGMYYVQSDAGSQATVDLMTVQSTGAPVQGVNIPALGASGWHNATMPLDATGDGQVTISDLREVFLDITLFGGRVLTQENGSQSRFVDVNNDGSATLTDLRLVFQAFVGGGEGEPESEPELLYDEPAMVVTESSAPPWMMTPLASTARTPYESQQLEFMAVESIFEGLQDFNERLDNDILTIANTVRGTTRPTADRKRSKEPVEKSEKSGTSLEPVASKHRDDVSLSRWDLVFADDSFDAVEDQFEAVESQPESPEKSGSKVSQASTSQAELPANAR